MTRLSSVISHTIKTSSDGVMAVLFQQDVAIVQILRTPTKAAMEEASSWMTGWVANQSQGIGLLVIIRGEQKPPSEEERGAVRAFYDRLGSQVRAVAYVIEQQGFWGATIRAILTGLQLIGRRPYATHVASDTEGGLEWLLNTLPPSPKRSSSAQMLETVRKFVETAAVHP